MTASEAAAVPAASGRTARRNALILATAQAVVGAAAPVSIAVGGLAGSWLLGADKSLATAPVTGYTLGVALFALPAAALMRRVGRRRGFVAGALTTATGGAVAAFALFSLNFWLFAAGLLLVGFGGAFVQQYRFAAADGAPDDFRPRAISWVLAGGVFAAIIGPQLVRYTNGAFPPTEFAGTFLGVIGLGVFGALVLTLLRVSGETIAETGRAVADARPLASIVAQPRFLTALLCGAGSYALMSFVMTGAPLAMAHSGHSLDISMLGIQWHVMAMYAPSFFTGRLILRFGKERIVGTGLLLLAASAIVALLGHHVWNFWLALILLGLGWNFSFIGATAMVSETYRPSEKSKTQGLHDFVLFSIVAFASLMSGQTFVRSGWETMNLVVLPIVFLCLSSLVLLAWLERRAGARG